MKKASWEREKSEPASRVFPCLFQFLPPSSSLDLLPFSLCWWIRMCNCNLKYFFSSTSCFMSWNFITDYNYCISFPFHPLKSSLYTSPISFKFKVSVLKQFKKIAKFQISYFYKAGAKDIFALLHYFVFTFVCLCVCVLK